ADIADHVDQPVVVHERGDVGRSRRRPPDHVAGRDVALASRANRHEGTAAITAARVDHAVVMDGHWYRKAVVLRDLPQALARGQVVPGHADARIDDDFGG